MTGACVNFQLSTFNSQLKRYAQSIGIYDIFCGGGAVAGAAVRQYDVFGFGGTTLLCGLCGAAAREDWTRVAVTAGRFVTIS